MVVYVDVDPRQPKGSLEAALGYVERALNDVEAELAKHQAIATPEWFLLRVTQRELTTIRNNLKRWEEERASQGHRG